LTPIIATLKPDQDLAKYQAEIERFKNANAGKLNGKMVMIREPRKLAPRETPDSRRYSGDQLRERAEASEPLEPITIDLENPQPPSDPEDRRRFNAFAPAWVFEKIRIQREEMYRDLYSFLSGKGSPC
jgi:hypothetical protein